MPTSLAGTRLAFIGGDLRQLIVAEAAMRLGGQIKTYALPSLPGNKGEEAAASLRDALAHAAAVVLPIGSIAADGRVRTLPDQPVLCLDEGFWRLLPRGSVVFVGRMHEDIVKSAVGFGHKVVQYAEDDEIAILNSIPTAEGALQLALENMPVTVHGSLCFVLGFGRVGQTTARLFKAVGAETWVFANRSALRARAHETGYPARVFSVLASVIDRADLIINTVPALVLSGKVIELTKPAVYLIDLASAPGGIDHVAARELGRNSLLARGLPGKVAPLTAGRILADTLPAIIERELK